MYYYYDIRLTTDIPHGLGILNQMCSVTVTPPHQPLSYRYDGTVFAWRQANLVAVRSQSGQVASNWGPGATGVLQIVVDGKGYSFGIAAIMQTPVAVEVTT